jgi:hypothetical protein
MANKSITARAVHTVGTGTVTALSVTTTPTVGRMSLHDCATPDQAGAHNEIWPRGAGSKITFNIGLVVNCTDANTGQTQGVMSITTA